MPLNDSYVVDKNQCSITKEKLEVLKFSTKQTHHGKKILSHKYDKNIISCKFYMKTFSHGSSKSPPIIHALLHVKAVMNMESQYGELSLGKKHVILKGNQNLSPWCQLVTSSQEWGHLAFDVVAHGI